MFLQHSYLIVFLALCFCCSISVCSAADLDGTPPNIVFILTDDQDIFLGGLTPMKKTEQLIGQHGITFDNMFVTSPLCCPSRSSILTGQYVHNHHARNNSLSGGCSSAGWQQGPEQHSVSTYMKKMGYKTFFGGKYLNQYGDAKVGGPEHVPPGWDEWYGLVGNSKYYNYTLSVNGKAEEHGQSYDTDYLTDLLKSEFWYKTFFGGKYLNQYGDAKVGGPEHVPPGWDEWYGLVGNSKYYNYTLLVNGKTEEHGQSYDTDYLTDLLKRQAVNFLKNQSGASTPFFMMVSTPACHSPFTAAPQYKNNFNSSKAPRTPAFNAAGGPTKHWLIRSAPHPMEESSITDLDGYFRDRWRTLLSVDDLVEQVISTLDAEKLLENTYVIFSSDNGFHLGQFSLPQDKRQLYEFDVRVPFMIRGPGVMVNKTLKNPILNIDIAPTIVELGGGKAPQSMDGRSILPLLKSNMKSDQETATVDWRKDFLVQHYGEGALKVPGCPHLSSGVYNCWPNCVCEDAWNNTYSCVRSVSSSEDMMYCEFKDREAFVELYDVKKDPHQLKNVYKDVSPKFLAAKHQRLVDLVLCAGDSCRKSSGETMDLVH